MRNRNLLALFIILFIAEKNYSQVLQGRVLGERGDMAAGVTVSFKNKANLIFTDKDGHFKITATKLPDTLILSAVGYESYKVVITEKNIKDPNFEVVLLNKRKMMDEVVVTALGTGRAAKELGYSVSPATEEYSHDVTYSKVSGLTIPTAPEKSAIRIRGASSIYTTVTGSGEFKTGTDSRYFSRDTVSPRDGMLAKSRVITAGEVNDFNKWTMWQDYSVNEFKYFTKTWNMFSAHRFTVQVTDKKHNPVMNEPVFLVDKITNDTAWKAWSDNTGKAELWGSFFDSSKVSEYYITSLKNEKINTVTEFSNGVNHLVVDRECQVSSDVDIAFMVDATGSMGDEIEFLKLELEDVIRSIMEKYSSLSLRAASVFYRDKGDEYLTKYNPFNEDLLKTLNFIKLQQAGGGGDFPESMDEGFETALDSLQWNPHSRARLLFMIMDAPPHGSARERMEGLIKKAASLGVRVIPIACSGTDKSTEFILRSIALATNGTYAFLTDQSGVGNKHMAPTTDKYEVELLNNLMQRIIGQFLFAKDCEQVKALQSPDTHQPDNLLEVKIYPNPTDGRFIIESKKQIKEIYISDFSGKLLMRLSEPDKQSNKKERWSVDISQYPSGTYLVKYITDDNKWGAGKVVLVH